MTTEPSNRRFGIELTPEQPVDELASLAVTAEEADFDMVFASHHYNNRDEFLSLAAMAEATESIQLGPGVTNPYETNPVTLASRMATFDELAESRGVFGIGPGDPSTLSNLGIEQDRPLRRVLETMQVARKLWAGERVTHDGTFEAVDAGLNYDARDIPVYVGGQGPHMTRMAAKYADGVLYNGSHPRDIEWAAERVKEGLADRPDHRGEFEFAAYASVSVAVDAAEARAAARPPVAFIAAGAPPPVLDRHDLSAAVATEIGTAISAGEFTDAFDLVTEPMLDAFAIAGTPETVEKRVDELFEHVDSVVFGSPLGPDIEEAISLMGARLQTIRDE